MRTLWTKIGLGALGVFLVGMLLVTVVEDAKSTMKAALTRVTRPLHVRVPIRLEIVNDSVEQLFPCGRNGCRIARLPEAVLRVVNLQRFAGVVRDDQDLFSHASGVYDPSAKV